MACLYICYQSVREPLSETQVVAYLEGLALVGYRTILLTFEPRPLSLEETATWRERLAAKGIAWYWLRYHKRPTVPATGWDVLAGIATGLRLIRKYHVRLVHARCHVPGLMALVLKYLTGVKFLFDVRGFMAEEYVDGGVWPAQGALFRLTKWVERRLVRGADGIVVLTEAAKRLFQDWYTAEIRRKPVEVIPCCVDFRGLPIRPPGRRGQLAAGAGRTIAYAGKLGGWYPVAAIVDFLRVTAEVSPQLALQVWTQSDAAELRRQVTKLGLDALISIGCVAPEMVPQKLAAADAGLCLYARNSSKACCSPTKVGEYLAAGLPVICSSGIGDTDALLSGESAQQGAQIGVCVADLSETAYRAVLPRLLDLINDPVTPQRCRAAAAKYFDLEKVGWPRYRAVYRALLGEG